jgi:hypothetical protein
VATRTARSVVGSATNPGVAAEPSCQPAPVG